MVFFFAAAGNTDELARVGSRGYMIQQICVKQSLELIFFCGCCLVFYWHSVLSQVEVRFLKESDCLGKTYVGDEIYFTVVRRTETGRPKCRS
jgi:hypothetical protein